MGKKNCTTKRIHRNKQKDSVGLYLVCFDAAFLFLYDDLVYSFVFHFSENLKDLFLQVYT